MNIMQCDAWTEIVQAREAERRADGMGADLLEGLGPKTKEMWGYAAV